jgi:pimeloyl-ACP methyl ester carboxylesterase
MGLAINIVLVVIFAAVTALIVFFILFFLRPIAMTVWLQRTALRRAGLRKNEFTTTIGKQIVWHGGAGPLLVLLHGAGDQAGTWSKVAPELKRHFQLAIPDLAGHGESEPVEGALSLGTLFAALEQVLDANPWRGAPMMFAGNSLGAWMAMLYAQKHPHRVTRVILINGGPIRNASELGLMPKDREEARRTLDAADFSVAGRRGRRYVEIPARRQAGRFPVAGRSYLGSLRSPRPAGLCEETAVAASAVHAHSH